MFNSTIPAQILSTLRPTATAWEVLEAEYAMLGDYVRPVVDPMACAIAAEDELKEARPRFQKPRNSFCIKLSPEQNVALADWHSLVSLGGKSRTILEMDFTDDGELVEVGSVTLQSSEFFKLTDLKGNKLVFHHWKQGQKASKRLRSAWRWADAIICCYSATLPSEYRHKAAVYSGGKVTCCGSKVESLKVESKA